MSNMIKNSWTLFTRNKEYVSSIVLTPIIILLIFSFVLSFRSKVNIAFINQDNGALGKMIEETITDMDFINLFYIDKNDLESAIINDKIEMAIILEQDASSIKMIKAQNSKLAQFVEIILNHKINSYRKGTLGQLDYSQNAVAKKGIPITNALGLIIFKMIGSASILASVILWEKKNGISNRIYMSKTKLWTYLVGRGSVFFLHLLIFSIIYYISVKLFRFDFGMRDPARILIVFLILGIFTTAFGLLLSAFVNDDSGVWSFNVLLLLPTSILSGALFPFNAMPKPLQVIGNLFPQRWITLSIEQLQKGGTLLDAFLPLSGVLLLSIIFIIVASLRLSRIRI